MPPPTSETDALTFLLVLTGAFIYVVLYVRFTDSSFVKRNIKRYLILRNLDNVYKPFLERYFTFYNSLDPKSKLQFERRVQKFIDIKEFIPRGGIKAVSPEMKVMIAGSAIQLTFGYPNIYFRHFWRILVYPDNYYSTITHNYHKGEVNRRGLIVLSWKSFKDGFSDQTDGINLGFHEMAHALRLINIVANEEYDFYDREIMKEFEIEASSETIKILNSPEEPSLFRNYSATNMDEFFAVAVECFFEKSYEFKQYNPKLYGLLTQILKVDPNQMYSAGFIKSIA